MKMQVVQLNTLRVTQYVHPRTPVNVQEQVQSIGCATVSQGEGSSLFCHFFVFKVIDFKKVNVDLRPSSLSVRRQPYLRI